MSIYDIKMLKIVLFSTCFIVGTLSQYNITQVHIAFSSSLTSLTIEWAVEEFPGTLVELRYKESSLPTAYAYATVFCRSFHNDNDDISSRRFVTCVSRMGPLTPNTYYDYDVGSEIHGFSTQYTLRSPRDSISSKFIVYADLGTGPQTVDTIASIHSKITTDTYDGIFHIGDIAYDLESGDGENGDLFLESIEPIASKIPYMVAQGNHENNGALIHYKKRFMMPGDSRNLWYSFNHGKVHFLVYTQEPLFTNDADADELLQKQFEFIGKDLEDLDRVKYPWLVVCTHRPFYCSEDNHSGDPYYDEALVQEDASHVNHNSDCSDSALKIRKNFEKLWNDYEVDLVLTGHVHNYERMHPVFNGTYQGCHVIDSNYCKRAKAPIYIISGVPGNQESYAFGSKNRPVYSAFQTSHMSFGVLEVFDGNHLHWEQITSDTLITLDYLDVYKT